MNNLQDLMLKLKGGIGSGNWGHSGRPGKKGGSSAGEKRIKNGVYPKPPAKGLYSATHVPVIDNLSYNSARESLALNAKNGVEDIATRYPKLKGKLVGATLQGSFLSEKERPKDIDIMLEFADEESMNYFAKTVSPTIIHTYSRVEFGFYSKESKVSVEVAKEYNDETKKRYNTDPIDISSWIPK